MKLYCIAVLAVAAVPHQALASTEGQTVLEFNRSPLFGYGSWEGVPEVKDGGLAVSAPNGKGGTGYNLNLDLSTSKNRTPLLHLEIGSGNEARAVKVLLQDSKGKKAAFVYELTGQELGQPVSLVPQDGASLADPAEGEPLLLTEVKQVQVLGNWRDERIEVRLSSVSAVDPTPEILASRAERAERIRLAQAEVEKEKRVARGEILRSEESPTVERVYAVDRNILAVSIREGVFHQQKLVPYQPEPGDQILREGFDVEVVQGGSRRTAPTSRILQRKVNGRLQSVGFIAGGRVDAEDLYFFPNETVSGDPLELRTVSDPETYVISSADDAGFGEGVRPVAVHRKSKPLNRAYPNNEQVVRHIIYLELPSELRQDATYQVTLKYLNTREEAVDYTHSPRAVRSEAIHTSHVGYRPDDPYKRAFLSLWMGDKRGHVYDGVQRFELLDDQGETVFKGDVERVLALDGVEAVRPKKNLSQTAVYALDFSGFNKPGSYFVHVPGVGVSYPVIIREDTWLNSFRQSMHGFLAQRNGIELGPPFTDFVRPRTFHPDDGVKIYQSTTSGGEAHVKTKYKDWFEGLVDGVTDEVVPEAWGGYNDAGDFDRAANHLWASYLHLELLDLFPDFCEQTKLALPEAEANDDLPDILNEALWGLGVFYRTQAENGGITAGIESSKHPRKGEDSVRDSLLLMAYAPSRESSYVYAATAARAARLLKKYDADLSTQYSESAKRAFEFAETTDDGGKGYGGVSDKEGRNVAAAELLMLTGDPKYDRAFQETNEWGVAPHVIDAQGGGFTYARLPNGVGDTRLKRKIAAAIEKQADAALKYGGGNAFGLTTEIADLPLIGPVGSFTVPGMNSQILPRAHYLTGKTKYLAGIVRSANFSAGANPDNRSMTTGVGYDPPIAPLHFDSRFTGQPAPAGLTMYGSYEPESLPNFAESNEWVHVWMLPKTMYPPSRTWPSTEFYVDFFLWPLMNEFTIRQNMGPTSYVWGYLAARESQ
ncbi:MAG: glycoside hydrolase family 9 protein [Planctomycetota bacterium]